MTLTVFFLVDFIVSAGACAVDLADHLRGDR